MSTIETSAPKRTEPPGPRPAGPWHLLWSRLSWPFVALRRKIRNRWLLARGIRRPRRWWRPRTWPETAFYAVLSVVYLLWILRYVWPGGPWWLLGPVPKWLDEQERLRNALTALGLSAATVMATLWFLGYRFRRARRRYLSKAKNDASHLVKPGSIIGEVVGRDQLCDALMSDLRNRRLRRPHVIVGSIGVGKTALLVRLTERLARKGAVPVVLQLQDVRDDGSEFDFSVLAKRRFADEVREWVSPAEAEKVWQRLRYRNDSIVVLADGLEDTLRDTSDRANKIRKAIAQADSSRLPLVMASRPQESLQAVRAARTVLEPLSEEAALRYVNANSGWRSDKRRLDWVVEAANVAESPLYLNIAKDLESRSLLAPIVGVGDKLSDPRDYDEWALRYDLLEAWVQALIDGRLHPEQSLSYYGRFMTVEHLSALACAALQENSTRVDYRTLAAAGDTEQPKAREAGNEKEFRNLLLSELHEREQREGAKDKALIDVRLAGSWGSRLGLVEEYGEGVKFQHSVLQAFLASRYMGPLVRSGIEEADRHEGVACRYFWRALRHPGRELDMALVFYSRSQEALNGCTSAESQPARGEKTQPARREKQCPIAFIRGILRDAGNRALASITQENGSGDQEPPADDTEQDPRIRALEMFTAALDIDSFHHKPEHRAIIEDIRRHWGALQEYNQRKLDPTKKILIKRIGAAARLISNIPPDGAVPDSGSTAYDHMFAMACLEQSHAVRFTTAQEIGDGGDDAFKAIWPYLRPRTDSDDEEQNKDGEGQNKDDKGQNKDDKRQNKDDKGQNKDDKRRNKDGEERVTVDKEVNEFVRNASQPMQSDLQPALTRTALPRTALPRTALSRMVPKPRIPDDSRPRPAPVTTKTERVRRKERSRHLRKQQQDQEKVAQEEREQDEQSRRAEIIQAWLAPMLVRSCRLTHHEGTPYDLVDHCMKKDLDLGLQLALAQGFKQAANHRSLPEESTAARDFLNGRSWQMLRQTSYWFARLTLIHALTLWALPEDVAQQQPRYGHGSNSREQVRRWMERVDPDGSKHTAREENPLVRAAGKLARQALQTRHPDRFIWIDEAGVSAQIGSETSSPHEPRLHNLWIPPSTGWSTLDPAAQQLLADVLVLLILTEERGDRAEDELLRLKRADRPAAPLLPHCLTRDRSPLQPMRAEVRAAPRSLPGSTCADGCPFELCPYPPKGPECRTELNELFCVHQRIQLNALQPQAWRFFKFRRRAPWQRHAPVANLRRFWDEMGARARDRAPEAASNHHR